MGRRWREAKRTGVMNNSDTSVMKIAEKKGEKGNDVRHECSGHNDKKVKT
jgi:hypothetical protein